MWSITGREIYVSRAIIAFQDRGCGKLRLPVHSRPLRTRAATNTNGRDSRAANLHFRTWEGLAVVKREWSDLREVRLASEVWSTFDKNKDEHLIRDLSSVDSTEVLRNRSRSQAWSIFSSFFYYIYQRYYLIYIISFIYIYIYTGSTNENFPLLLFCKPWIFFVFMQKDVWWNEDSKVIIFRAGSFLYNYGRLSAVKKTLGEIPGWNEQETNSILYEKSRGSVDFRVL